MLRSDTEAPKAGLAGPASIKAPASTLERQFAGIAHGERTPSVSTSQSAHPLPFLEAIQSSFGRHDISHVRAHTDSRAAANALAMGAEAFASGPDVTFSRKPSLHTAAHEAAHVVQQQAGLAVSGGMGQAGDAYERQADEVADRVARGQSSEDLLDANPGGAGSSRYAMQDANPAREVAAARPPVIQMRRIPPNLRDLLTAVTGADGANFGANAEGAQRLIDNAWAELTALEKKEVTERIQFGLIKGGFEALPLREQLIRKAEAILWERGISLQLGDPAKLDVLPRAGTDDAANITKLVNHANDIFADIASGARDEWIKQVFGAANVASAKSKYAAARARMNTLHTTNHIITDRGSGFSKEVEEGGLSGSDSISVAPTVIDDPDENQSIVILIHESMHTASLGIGDDVYIDAPGFKTQPPAKKLHNAAHFEVVPWRILDPTNPGAFAIDPSATPPTFETFVPAGASGSSGPTPPRTKAQEGSIAAYELLNSAWALGLNLHRKYVQLFVKPTDWTVPQFGGAVRFDNSIPFWSKVQKLTIHKKTDIDPASTDEAKHPVSQIDIALSEGVTRKIVEGMDLLHPLDSTADVLAFEEHHATDDERSAAFPGDAHTNVNTERDFLLKLAVRNPEVAPITGDVARDLRVVRKMADPILKTWDKILAPRNPSSFPD